MKYLLNRGNSSEKVVEAKTPYEAVRKVCNFLTDDNHKVELTDSRVKIIRNERSSRSYLKPFWHDDSPGQMWFNVPYLLIENDY